MFKFLRIFRNGKTILEKGSKTLLRPVTRVNAVASRGKADYTTIKGIFYFCLVDLRLRMKADLVYIYI